MKNNIKEIAESNELFKKLIINYKCFYLSKKSDNKNILKERINVISLRNKNISPVYDTDYYCGTCGMKDGSEHPTTGFCFHCDTDNWILKNK
jgi:hypothetical protein